MVRVRPASAEASGTVTWFFKSTCLAPLIVIGDPSILRVWRLIESLIKLTSCMSKLFNLIWDLVHMLTHKHQVMPRDGYVPRCSRCWNLSRERGKQAPAWWPVVMVAKSTLPWQVVRTTLRQPCDGSSILSNDHYRPLAIWTENNKPSTCNKCSRHHIFQMVLRRRYKSPKTVEPPRKWVKTHKATRMLRIQSSAHF